jgi:hypothetical protein
MTEKLPLSLHYGTEKMKNEEGFADPARSLILPVNSEKINEIQETLDEMAELQKRALSTLEQQHRFLFSNKPMLQQMWELTNLSYNMAQWTTVEKYAIDAIGKRLTNLERIVEEITQKLNIDLSNVKSEMENLKKTLNSEDIASVNQFVKQIQDNIEKYKSKMEENDLAE